ncbi:MAG: hypothetical protein GIW99_07545 [Candidatus Eremiobacteraeota bacterium]|nr:hypothetical protein [Candidatus Eremiobacteraeota bacterium]
MTFLAFAAVFGAAIAASGCQQKAIRQPNDLIAADGRTLTVRGVDRYADQQGAPLDQIILIVRATFTNASALPESVSPNKFMLTDLMSGSTYLGLWGGDINVPAGTSQTVAPAQSLDVTVGFRVPVALGPARLSFSP